MLCGSIRRSWTFAPTLEGTNVQDLHKGAVLARRRSNQCHRSPSMTRPSPSMCEPHVTGRLTQPLIQVCSMSCFQPLNQSPCAEYPAGWLDGYTSEASRQPELSAGVGYSTLNVMTGSGTGCVAGQPRPGVRQALWRWGPGE